MSGAISFLARQAQKQVLKTAITKSTGLDDFLGIKPLNENEDIVMNELLILRQEKMFLYGQNKIITMPLILMDFLKIICYKTCAINIEN